ncbi:MAG: MotA/TolQ/ExbB proton channel family protein [Pirellulales bacterium]|nr:MotA/TolQ/ExbB proton channel family protein [Pirellulales bacterium]
MDVSKIIELTANACYGALALAALWGAFCSIVVWRRVRQIRFRNEEEQTTFLTQVEENIQAGDYPAAEKLCHEDPRAVPQLAALALANRDIGFTKVRSLIIDRFQRDVLADLEYRLSWVNTMIKSAPMLGLYGTVLGMIGAFQQLYASETVEAKSLAGNIYIALITTALGLTIAIPLIIGMNSINVQIRKMEDLVGYGMSRILESLKNAPPSPPGSGAKKESTR